MKAKRPKLVLKRMEKLEEKLLRRIDALQRNLLELRALRISIDHSQDGSKTPTN